MRPAWSRTGTWRRADARIWPEGRPRNAGRLHDLRTVYSLRSSPRMHSLALRAAAKRGAAWGGPNLGLPLKHGDEPAGMRR